MEEAKFRKKVVAITVGAVLLTVILLFVVIYQLIAIGVSKAEQRRLDAEIAHIEQLIDESEQTLDARTSDWYQEILARKEGYHYPEDKIFSGD